MVPRTLYIKTGAERAGRLVSVFFQASLRITSQLHTFTMASVTASALNTVATARVATKSVGSVKPVAIRSARAGAKFGLNTSSLRKGVVTMYTVTLVTPDGEKVRSPCKKSTFRM